MLYRPGSALKNQPPSNEHDRCRIAARRLEDRLHRDFRLRPLLMPPSHGPRPPLKVGARLLSRTGSSRFSDSSKSWNQISPNLRNFAVPKTESSSRKLRQEFRKGSRSWNTPPPSPQSPLVKSSRSAVVWTVIHEAIRLGSSQGSLLFNFPAMVPDVDVSARHRHWKYISPEAFRTGSPNFIRIAELLLKPVFRKMCCR